MLARLMGFLAGLSRGGSEEGLGVAYQCLQIVGQLPRIKGLIHVGAPSDRFILNIR
jgi:hypothetical protein